MWVVGLNVGFSQKKEKELQVGPASGWGEESKLGSVYMCFYLLPAAYKVSESYPLFFKLHTKWKESI